jgi:hypothetical protein
VSPNGIQGESELHSPLDFAVLHGDWEIHTVHANYTSLTCSRIHSIIGMFQ